MVELLLILMIVLVLAGFAGILFMINQNKQPVQDDTALGLIKADLQAMKDAIDRSGQQTQASVFKQMSESSKIITDVTNRLAKLDETNRRVVDVADELKTLQNVLQNPKQRGVLGEYYLESVLDNVMAPDQYQLQYEFKNGEKVDAVIFLQQGKILPIDSKFSLENYNRLRESKVKGDNEALVKLFKQDLKNRIDETAKYIRPDENTMDFAFMFIPSEAIYYDLLINQVGTTGTSARDLIEYAFRDKHVIIVSPTSFMAYLQTVLQGLRSLKIEEQAKEIQKRVGQLGQHLAAYDTYFSKVGNSLSTTVNHYNTAHKELGKIDKDVMRIAGTTPAIEPLLVDKPSTDE
jgi:DNA recombination protein RmuC